MAYFVQDWSSMPPQQYINHYPEQYETHTSYETPPGPVLPAQQQYHHSHFDSLPTPASTVITTPYDLNIMYNYCGQFQSQTPISHSPYPQDYQQLFTSPAGLPIPLDNYTPALSPAASPPHLGPAPYHDFVQEPLAAPIVLPSPPATSWSPAPSDDTLTGLESLRDPSPGQLPGYSIKQLMACALQGSPTGRLSMREIYEAIEARFPIFTQPIGASWRNSARHDISFHDQFVKTPRLDSEPGKGNVWTYDPTIPQRPPRRRKRAPVAPAAPAATGSKSSASSSYHRPPHLTITGAGAMPPLTRQRVAIARSLRK